MSTQKLFEHQGKLHTFKELSNLSQQPEQRIRNRITRGWGIDAALNQPVLTHSQAGKRGKLNTPWIKR
jgi:hypothetical protein